MRPFTVVWWEYAQSRLAELWILSADKQAITHAAAEIDRRLATDPESCIESNHEGLSRMTVDPLTVQFTIDDDNRTVIV